MMDAGVLDSFEQVSNWGRWGPNDEMGTLNFITPAKIHEAANLVRSGRVVSIAHDLSVVASAKNAVPIKHTMVSKGGVAHGAFDELTIYSHGLFQTHLDAVAHIFHQGKAYNGRSASDILGKDGLAFGSIHAQRGGIVTRGVLLDVARSREVDWLQPEESVSARDLEAAERLSGVTVTTGDAVFIRIGLGRREATAGPEDPSIRAGIGPDCPAWLHEREVALVGSDCPEKLPTDYPDIGLVWHIAALVYMGLSLIDSAALEPLAQACAEEKHNDFLFTVAPLPFPRGTGSAVNPLCIF
jgi:kynurenine formamidase